MRNPTVDMVLSQTYRRRESKKKIKFILERTHITLHILVKAASLIRKNEYHNFDHVLNATVMGIKIAEHEGYTKEEVTEIAFALLLHDAGHQGFATPLDEKSSVFIMNSKFSEEEFKSIQLDKKSSVSRIKFKILATIFTERGKSKNPDACIMQDADISHIGQGPYYWLWSSMGLMDEFNKLRTQRERSSPVTFIKTEQRIFIEYLERCSGNKGSIWLSDGGQYILNEPSEDLIKIEFFTDQAIQYAYSVRFADILVSELKENIHRMDVKRKTKQVA